MSTNNYEQIYRRLTLAEHSGESPDFLAGLIHGAVTLKAITREQGWNLENEFHCYPTLEDEPYPKALRKLEK